MGVSGYFDRSADEAARRLGVGPRFRDTDPRPLPYPELTTDELVERGLKLGISALIPTAESRTASGKKAGALPFTRPDPHRDAVDLADEIRAGDFEDRGWMIDALDRAEAMLRAWPDGRR